MVTVGSREEAIAILKHFTGEGGWVDTTRLGAPISKALFNSKGKTFHWDEVYNPKTGWVEGHDALHGMQPHLQIHLENGGVIRINFPPKSQPWPNFKPGVPRDG